MPATGDFTGIVVHSDMPLTGQFACSDSLLNQLQHNIQWGQRGNFVDVPTDCPQRDERLGWTGDAQAFSRTAAYNFQVGGFFTKWLADVAADQDTAGNVPYVIPNVLGPNAKGSTGWADAATIVPWAVYQTYGDKRILEKQYPSMKAWVEYMRNKAGKNLLWNTGFHFGDWLFYRPNDDNDGRSAVTDKYIIAQSFFIHSTDLLQKAAEILGYQEDAAAYGNLAKQLREAYMREYVTPNGRLLSSTQTAYVLALQFDILPESLRQQTAGRLAENIQRYQNHLTTGFLGTPYITHVLTRFGYNNLAYNLLQQQDYPSWLYPVKMGATTIWERWDGIKPDGSFQTEGMNSFNHYAYGAIGEWMYRNVAGLQIDPSHPGYEHLILSPLPGGTLTSAISHLETIKGQAGSGWYLEQNNIRIVAEVPANTTATVRLPYAPDGLVRESGKALETGNGIHSMQQDGQSLVLELGSGKYEFSYPTTLFPDRNYKFTLASPLVDMLGNAKAKGLLDKHFPGLSEHPQLDRFKQMTLSQVLDQYIWTADNLADFEAELKQIK